MMARKNPKSLGGEIYSRIKNVEILNDRQRAEVDSQSLGRFPAANSVEIDWEKVPHKMVSGNGETGPAEALLSFIKDWPEEEKVVILWMGMPYVRLPVLLVREQAEDIVQSSGSLSVVNMNRGIMVDCMFDGMVVKATIDPVSCDE